MVPDSISIISILTSFLLFLLCQYSSRIVEIIAFFFKTSKYKDSHTTIYITMSSDVEDIPLQFQGSSKTDEKLIQSLLNNDK